MFFKGSQFGQILRGITNVSLYLMWRLLHW